MITEGSQYEFQRIPIADLRVTEYQVRYPDRLKHYIDLMLSFPASAPGFILVKRLSDCPSTYEVLDGHHRFVAHIMTGRENALCIVIEEPNEPRTDDQGSSEELRSFVSAPTREYVGQASSSDLSEAAIRWQAGFTGELVDIWKNTGRRPDVRAALPVLGRVLDRLL